MLLMLLGRYVWLIFVGVALLLLLLTCLVCARESHGGRPCAHTRAGCGAERLWRQRLQTLLTSAWRL